MTYFDDKIKFHYDGKSKIALAVSGGVDSVAMLYIMLERGLTFTVLTVDHNLRPEAKAEAQYVAETSQKLGLEHVTLEWKHDGIQSNVHDQARDARYNLMTEWCQNNGVNILCTAHHLDDRVEHFFIRVSRGAGLLGLLDYYEMMYRGISIIRPLFDCSKTELIDYLKNKNIKWYEDKSNDDDRYLRTTIRKWLTAMPTGLDLDLFKRRVVGVKANLQRAADVIQRLFEEFLREDVEIFDGKVLIKKLPQDDEIVYMMLSHLLKLVGGQNDPPRMSSMQILYTKMKLPNFKRSTLSGCIVQKTKDGFLIYPEY